MAARQTPSIDTTGTTDTPTLTAESFDLVRVRDSAAPFNGAHRTVRRFIAEATDSMTVLEDRPAVDRDGLPLPIKPNLSLDAAGEPLKGDALDEALLAAGLPTDGLADDKRARLAHFDGDSTLTPTQTTDTSSDGAADSAADTTVTA